MSLRKLKCVFYNVDLEFNIFLYCIMNCKMLKIITWFLYSCQISYDLTRTLTKNKDSLPQNLQLTMKCKYQALNTNKSTMCRQSMLEHKGALLFKNNTHKNCSLS